MRHRGDWAVKYFTLIELLVVVAIIAILVSMIMPALKRARQNAYLVACKNNHHQIGIATNFYADDSNGMTALSNWGTYEWDGYAGYTLPPDQRRGWLYDGLNAYSDWITAPYKSSDADRAKGGVYWTYLNSKAIFHCPSSPYDFTIGVNKISSYLMNSAVNNYGAPSGPPLTPDYQFRLEQFRADDVLLFEPEQRPPSANEAWGWQDGADTPVDMKYRADYYGILLVFPPYHMDLGIISCFDGHVENIDAIEWVAATSAPNPFAKRTRYYCSPKTPD